MEQIIKSELVLMLAVQQLASEGYHSWSAYYDDNCIDVIVKLPSVHLFNGDIMGYLQTWFVNNKAHIEDNMIVASTTLITALNIFASIKGTKVYKV